MDIICKSKPAIYFGKYAGIPIEDFQDINYLYWVKNHPDIWPKLSKGVQKAINVRLTGRTND